MQRSVFSAEGGRDFGLTAMFKMAAARKLKAAAFESWIAPLSLSVGRFRATFVFGDLNTDRRKAVSFQHHRKGLGGLTGGIDRVRVGAEVAGHDAIVKVDPRFTACRHAESVQLAEGALGLAAVPVLDRIVY